MSEKHYVIALEKGADKDQIMDELKRDTSADASVSSSTIPDRQVQQVNQMRRVNTSKTQARHK